MYQKENSYIKNNGSLCCVLLMYAHTHSIMKLHQAKYTAAIQELFYFHKYKQPHFAPCGLIEQRILKNNIKLNTYICTQNVPL